ncbi:MAG: hypothetical protein IH621_09555 [Krumholzibacteria bacterium]|nr:hypothetical protein [Candidatus Krumholzibacteria bacterium]
MRTGTATGVEPDAVPDFGSEGLHPALVQLRRQALARAGLNEAPVRMRRLGLGPRLAVAFSHAASPPVMAAVSFVLLASTLPGTRPWAWTGAHVAVAVLFPLGALVVMHRRGEVRDLELTRRDQRTAPLLLTLLCAGLSLFAQAIGGAPAPLVSLAVAWTALVLALLVVTRRWKISVHTAGLAVAGALLWKLHGSPAWLLAGVTALGTARVVLGRHTVAQVVAGALLGATAVIFLVAA